ncbi:Mobile element protein [Geitlerinema sp. FC II]|nr:Mobile element protein [Geitlerinema sp. FC II]
MQTAKEHNVWNTTKLHHLTYKPVREATELKANHVCQAIRRVVNQRKATQQIHKFRPTSVSLDVRTFRYIESKQQVGVTLKSGRVNFDLKIGGYQIALLRGQTPTSATLKKTRQGDYYINIVVEVPTQPKGRTPKVLGVDRGLRDIATTSTGKSWNGEQLRATREKYVRVRASIQAKRTKSAKRLLRRLSGRESRFQSWVNHNISKELVREAKATESVIAFEDLTGIRLNVKLRKKTRTEIHRWAFYQLQLFTEYKANIAGVEVVTVDPRYTSQTCSRCHHVHPERGKSYRNGKRFKCGFCGFEHDADVNGALNIAQLGAVVTQPEISTYQDPSQYSAYTAKRLGGGEAAVS